MFYDISFGNILLFSWWPWDPMGYRPLYVYVLIYIQCYNLIIAWLSIILL